jgi:hypothetical protein
MFGVGIYNASSSGLGNNFTGEYYPLLGKYTTETSGAAFLIETGILGLALALLLDWLVFRDAVFVARRDTSLFGALALGWLGIMVVIAIATFYKSLHYFESISYLFWYFAGVIAAQRMRLELGELGHASLSDSGRPPGLDDIPRRVHHQEPRPLKLGLQRSDQLIQPGSPRQQAPALRTPVRDPP